jgi:hypothetical protein
VFVRYLHVIVSISLIFMFSYTIVENSLDAYVSKFNVVTILTMLLISRSLLYLHVSESFDRSVSFLKLINYYSMTLVIVVISVLAVTHVSQSTNIFSISLRQNFIDVIPMWNMLVLAPIFIVWVLNRVDLDSVIINRKDRRRITEVEKLQERSMISFDLIAWSLITIYLFMGGDKSFNILDSLGLAHNIFTLLIVVTIKMILLFMMYFIVLKLIPSKGIEKLTRVAKSRIYVVIVYYIALLIFKGYVL